MSDINDPELTGPTPEQTAAEFTNEEKEFADSIHAAGGGYKAEAAEGEVTQPQAVQPTPQAEPRRAISIRDTEKTAFMDPNLYIQMKAMANDFIASKAIPACWQTPSQVLVGLQTGLEMGMKPMEALNSLYYVNGAINVWGKATTRRVKEHGYDIAYSDESQESCTGTVTKKNAAGKVIEKYVETFTFEDAKLSGYTGAEGNLKVGWKPGMNRRKKLRYGVLSLIISTYIPEVLGSAMGIVEVSDDYDLGTNKAPAQLADGKTDRQAMMLAAEAKHKELNGNKKFKPQAITAQLEED